MRKFTIRKYYFSELFLQQKIVDYKARAGAGATILTSWSRIKLELLPNTDSRAHVGFRVSSAADRLLVCTEDCHQTV